MHGRSAHIAAVLSLKRARNSAVPTFSSRSLAIDSHDTGIVPHDHIARIFPFDGDDVFGLTCVRDQRIDLFLALGER